MLERSQTGTDVDSVATWRIPANISRLSICADTLLYNLSAKPSEVNESPGTKSWLPTSPKPAEGDHVAPDGGYGWFVTIGSFMSHVIEGGFERSDGIFLLYFLENFGQSNQVSTLPCAMASTLRCLLSPFASNICNKFSIRASVILGAALFTSGVFFTQFKINFYILCFTYGFLTGVGRAFFAGPALIIIGLYFSRRQGVASGLASSGVGFGTFILIPLFDFMLANYGYSGAFLFMSGVAGNVFIVGMLYRPLSTNARYIRYNKNGSPPSKSHKATASRTRDSKNVVENTGNLVQVNSSKFRKDAKSERNTSYVPRQTFYEIKLDYGDLEGDKRQVKTQPRDENCFKNRIRCLCLKRWLCENCCCVICCPVESFNKHKNNSSLCHFHLLGEMPFLFYCLSIFLFMAGFKVTYLFLPTFMVRIGYTIKDSANVLAITGPIDTLSRVLIGLIVDTDTVRPYRMRVFNLALLVLAISTVLVPQSKILAEPIVMMTFVSSCTGISIALRTVVLVDLLGVSKLASSFGLLMFFQGIGALTGPTVGGFLLDNFGDVTYGYYFATSCIVLSAFFMHLSITFYSRNLHVEQ